MQVATGFSSYSTFDQTADIHSLVGIIQANKTLFQQSPELLAKLLSPVFSSTKKERKKILLPQGHGFTLIDEEDIMYLEADGSYTRVFLRDSKRIMVSRALKEFVGIAEFHLFRANPQITHHQSSISEDLLSPPRRMCNPGRRN